MPSLSNLREYLAALRNEGELVEIDAPADPVLEIPEIHRRVISAGGPAILFKNPKGASFPVVTNLYGTAKRVDIAFGPKPQQFVREVAELALKGEPPKLGDLWKAKGLLPQALKLRTKKAKSGPVFEVEQSPPHMTRLPHLQLWPEDGGPFVTLGHIFTRSPEGGPPNLGIYRMQVYDDTTTGMHWQIGKGGGFHYSVAQQKGVPLPVSVFLGGPPALLLSSLAPLPEGVPEMLLIGLLQGKRLQVREDKATGHSLPIECEFILQGKVAPDKTHPEGPFGDHYGYYSLVHDYPVFECESIYHRNDAIYPATVVGKPRQEDFYLGNYLQELLSPIFPLVMPSVIDLWSYGDTGFHSLSAAVVKERYAREAMMSAFRILGEGQLSLTKFLMLTDQRVDLKNFKKFLEHILARCRWETDLFLFSNLSMDTLDYAGPEVNRGSKGVLMGLGQPVRELLGEWSGEPPPGCWEPIVFSPGCLVIGGPTHESDPEFAKDLATHPAILDWQLVVLVDRPRQAAASEANFLWTAFTRFDPAMDLHSRGSRVRNNHLAHESPIVLDARMKPWYPKELFADTDTAKKVESRWSEYFPQGNVEMGSSDLASLDPDLV